MGRRCTRSRCIRGGWRWEELIAAALVHLCRLREVPQPFNGVFGRGSRVVGGSALETWHRYKPIGGSSPPSPPLIFSSAEVLQSKRFSNRRWSKPVAHFRTPFCHVEGHSSVERVDRFSCGWTRGWADFRPRHGCRSQASDQRAAPKEGASVSVSAVADVSGADRFLRDRPLPPGAISASPRLRSTCHRLGRDFLRSFARAPRRRPSPTSFREWPK